VFRVAERLSLISDALYLEGMLAQESELDSESVSRRDADPDTVSAAEQARAVAHWIKAGRDAGTFPGRRWLRQPTDCSDRDWILEIARQYRALDHGSPHVAGSASRAGTTSA
jgi:hypothetical protein